MNSKVWFNTMSNISRGIWGPLALGSLVALLAACGGAEKGEPAAEDVAGSDVVGDSRDLSDGKVTSDLQPDQMPADSLPETVPADAELLGADSAEIADLYPELSDAVDQLDLDFLSGDIPLDLNDGLELQEEVVVPPDPPEGSLFIVKDGHSDFVIFLPAEASPSEQTAAQELQSFVEQCTGVLLPIISAPPTDQGAVISLGMSPWAEANGVAPTQEQLGDQGYLIRTAGPHLFIAGTPKAGTLYGVHRLLEQHLGVRWLAPGVTVTPASSLMFVPPVDEIVQPAFFWRDVYYAWPGADEPFLTRQGENSGHAGPDSPWGAKYSNDGQAHSYFWYLNPDEFYDTHPEYFSEIGGVRVRDETQLCLTNPDVLDIVTERMLQRMEANPDATQHNFSQMDRYNYCQCDQCRAMNELYGTAGATQFWFVNELAKRTSQVYPEKLIGTLAYMYTEPPPQGMEMHPNVAVWLCHMYPSCDSHPIATCPHNARYKERAEAWSAITQHLYIWHYIVDFSHYYNPFPNFGAMASDMQFYRDIGVEGIFLQGMGQSGGGGEWSLLRPYYGAKLLWDPDLEPQGVIKDFLKGYYGNAWKPLWNYIQLLQTKVDDDDVHMHLYTNPGQGYLPDEIISQSMEFFDQAEAAVAGDAELLERVRVARMPMTYARMFPRNGYTVAGDKLHWGGQFPTTSEFMGFVNRMKAHGFQLVREVGGDVALLMLLFTMFNKELDVAILDNGLVRVEVVPTLGCRTLRILDKTTGHCVTAHNVVEALFFPFAGGVEDRIGGQLEAYGWAEPGTLVSADATSITTTQNTLNGYHVERTVQLEPGSREIRFYTTVRNDNPSARVDRFRYHVEWDLGTLQETQVLFTNLAGNEVTPSLDDIIAGQREGQYFYNEEAPAGSWTFSGDKGLLVTQSWDPEEFEHAWLYSFPVTQNELEAEVWTGKLHIEPGESRTFSHSITINP